MSEVRLINANAAISVFADMGQDIDTHDVIDLLKEQPTVDAVPVVRCGECKHRIGTIYARDGMTILKVCKLKHGTNRIDFYCKDGERDE